MRFRVLQCGDGPRAALLLHGFPDDAGSMVPLMEHLAAAGYRCTAPYLRGYGETDPAPDGNYQISALADDAHALLDALGHDRALVVGHDWGAVTGYVLAAAAPERLTHLVTMAVPPLPTVIRNFPRDPAQLLRSWYILFFQLPFLPERVVRAGDFAFVERLWRRWSPGWTPPPGRLDAVKATLGSAGSLRAALAYYRGLGVHAPFHLRAHLEMRRRALAPVPVPTLVLAGATDGCMGLELFADAPRDIDARGELRVVPGAGHFLPLEAQAEVARHILEFVGRV